MGDATEVDDRKTFAALRVLVDEQKLALGVNLTIANTPGNPGYRGYENLFAMWGTIAAVIFTFIGFGWLIGLFSVPVGIVIFLIAGRVVQKRAGRRTRRWALSSASRFSAMWKGGVVSVRDTESGMTAIFARGDDLGEFVRTALSEILAAKGDGVSKRLEVAFARLASES